MRYAIAIVLGLAVVASIVLLIVAPGSPPNPPAHPAPVGKAAPHGLRLPQLPGQAAPTGGPRLTGFVVDGAGLPVEDAVVSGEPEKLAGGTKTPAAPATAPVTATGAPLALAAPPTAADGHFVLDGLPAGRARIRVTGAGLLPAEVRYVSVPSDELRIVIARHVSIDGTVTDGGAPVANVTVGIRGDALGGTLEVKTDSKGAFHAPDLPEGRYQVFAYQGALAARAMRIARLGAGPFGPVELRLEAAAIVVGHVIDRDEGTALPAAIELRPQGDDQAPRYARAGPDGTFRIEGVPNGHWIADAFSPGYLQTGGVELEAGHGVAELALVRGGTIEGRVLDGAGNPVAGATVRAVTTLAPGATPTSSLVEVSAEVDRDKLRRFSGRTAAPAPTTSTGALAADPQFVPRGELGVLVGPIPPIPPPGAVVASAAPSADPTAAAAGLLGEPAPLPPADTHDPLVGSPDQGWTTGADGRYRIRGVPRGSFTVLATAAAYAEGRSRSVSLDPGQLVTGVDISISAGTFLVGTVRDQHGSAVAGAQVTATPAVGFPLDAFTDDSGAYRLGPLSGTIELSAHAYGHGEARRTVDLPPSASATPDERTEDLVLEVADAVLAGTLDDATGAPIPGASVEIVGGAADGRRVTVTADGTFAFDELPAGHVRLRVSHPAYPTDELDAIAAPGHPAAVRLRLALGGAAEGVVLDQGGQPLSNIPITAKGPGDAREETSSDAKGTWHLGPVKPGAWRLAIHQAGYLPLVRELDIPAARAPGDISVRDVRLDLVLGATLGGTVRDSRGARLPNARVFVRLADGSGPAAEGDADAQGEFRIHDCPTGDVVVSATAGGSPDQPDLQGATRVTARGGDEILGLSLELR
ncbi:MAG TPA: carboxypeptidase-like regulatory domain-containing protein [Kofleriaceae bacterium]